jgi:hypothetical protein
MKRKKINYRRRSAFINDPGLPPAKLFRPKCVKIEFIPYSIPISDLTHPPILLSGPSLFHARVVNSVIEYLEQSGKEARMAEILVHLDAKGLKVPGTILAAILNREVGRPDTRLVRVGRGRYILKPETRKRRPIN